MKFLASTVCDFATRVFCEDVVFIIAGFDQKQLNEVSNHSQELDSLPTLLAVRGAVSV